jgi:very-short-patch-repair endonuclease
MTHIDASVSLALQMDAAGLPAFVAEHKFHPIRRWRFDFSWPALKVACEIDGGTWAGGRHTRGTGFENDCVKINAAILLGWRVLRFTPAMIEDGRAIKVLEELLLNRREPCG